MTTPATAPRSAALERSTSETDVTLRLDLDGTGRADIATGIAFFDHMLHALTKHARFDLTLRVEGDLVVDDHHTVEDVAIVLGRALNEALGERRGIARFAHAYAPLDEALVRAVVDLSGRPWPEVHLGFTRERLGALSTENIVHFFNTLGLEARMALHVDALRARNDHHLAEAAFKAVALALRAAVAPTGEAGAPSTKGVLA